MEKLSGGSVLECGHAQVVSTHRIVLANSGYDQHSVWCIECSDWTTLAPAFVVPETSQEDTSLEQEL